MDPGNWATDLAGGARYGYTLLSVIMLSNLMAILLQALAARLGIASGRDLAQACRDSYSRPIDDRPVDPLRDRDRGVRSRGGDRRGDRAESALRPAALWGVLLTALDVLIVLYLQHRGFRYVEALVVGLILAIAGSFAIELWLARPAWGAVAAGFVPTTADPRATRTCSTSPSASSARR